MTQTKFNLVIVDEPYHKWSEVCAALLKENKQLKKFCEEFNALNVSKENQRLKELLKECRPYINRRCIQTRETLTKSYTASDKVLHKKAEKLLTKIDEVLK